MAFESISLPYGEEKLQGFKDTKTNNIFLPENIEGLGLITLYDISPGQSKTINLKEEKIDFPVVLSSILASSSQNARRGNISFNLSILDKDDTEFLFEITDNESKSLSLTFPLNTIVRPSDLINIKTQYSLNKVMISFKKVALFADIEERLTIDISSIAR